MSEIFNEIIYRPLLNLVVFLYNVIPGSDFGLAIIVLTVLVRLVFLPLTIKTTRSQKAINEINPQVQAIKEKFKHDKALQSTEILKLYKDKKVSPLSGCLPLLVQLPILFALYKAFGSGFTPESLNSLYSFVSNPGTIEKLSLGFIDITSPNHLLTIATGVTQFLQIKSNPSASSGPKEMQSFNRQMMFMFPVMIVIIGWNLPAALMIYWVTATLAAIAEQVYIKRIIK